MRPMPLLLLLGMTLQAPVWASEEHAAAKPKAAKDEYAKSTKESRSKPAKTEESGTRRLKDLESRLKRLESENSQLKHELAGKGPAAETPTASEASGPEGALAELRAGNARFVAGARTRSQFAANDPALRQTLAKGQSPFAVIVTCSDSRLGDNFIFDQELGRLFTIREAGNCPDIQGLASIEYAVEHLGSKVVVILGHGSCGAVKAVFEAGPKPLPGNLWSLQAAMAGLTESVPHDPHKSAAEHMGRLVESNTVRQAQAVLERSEIVRHLCSTGKLQVVPAVYDLASGKVSYLKLPEAEAPKEPAHH